MKHRECPTCGKHTVIFDIERDRYRCRSRDCLAIIKNATQYLKDIRMKDNGNKRKQVSQEVINNCIEEIKNELTRRLEEKGYGGFASTHEIFGVVHEEVQELGQALKNDDNVNFKEELFDIIVGCVFGIASMDAETTDW